ncbi:MAG: S-layer homology domain-containing protein [Dethiosulfatibacter sp.]|nr:S-layer homology domain-containing protein [Dethiosulfatibacter sp.]
MKFTKLKSFILVGAILLILPMFTQAFAVESFSDLDNAEWAKETIMEWVDKGLISGYEDGTFKPNQEITRAEYTKLMFNAYAIETDGKKDFSDVFQTDWHYDVVTKMAYLGHVNGYPDGTFKPDALITRAEAATILFNIEGLEANEEAADIFLDSSMIPGWAKGIIGAVYEAGYILGYPDGTFKSDDYITRAESVFMINNSVFVETEEEVEEPVVDPLPPGGGGGGGGLPPTPTESNYGFRLIKGSNTYLIGEKEYVDNTTLSFNMISTIFDENIGNYPEAVDLYTGFFERALAKETDNGNPYALSLASRIKYHNTLNSTTPPLKAFIGIEILAIVDEVVADGNATVEQIRAFAEIMADSTLSDLVDDLALLYPTETTPLGFEFTIYGEVGTSTGYPIKDLKATFEDIYDGLTLAEVAGETLISLTHGDETISFVIVDLD